MVGPSIEAKVLAGPEAFSASMRGSIVPGPSMVVAKGSSADGNPEAAKESLATSYTLAGSYLLESGPSWSTYPPTYSCQAACAKLFGGQPENYAGSVSDLSITNTCYYEKYGGSSTDATLLSASYLPTCPTFSSNGCYSAYVQDHTAITSRNYCYTNIVTPTLKPSAAPSQKPTIKPTTAIVPNAYRGSFYVNNGPSWSTTPVTYTCQQACALIFGGQASDYQGSTSASTITNTCFAQKYAGTQSPYLIPEDYSVCTLYSSTGCMSTYVSDQALTVYNYCYNRK